MRDPSRGGVAAVAVGMVPRSRIGVRRRLMRRVRRIVFQQHALDFAAQRRVSLAAECHMRRALFDRQLARLDEDVERQPDAGRAARGRVPGRVRIGQRKF